MARKAIDYLSGKGAYADRAAKHGANLPIVVMSSSNQESDIKRAMALGATAYRVKPGSLEYLLEVARELGELVNRAGSSGPENR
jgi:CheY-like chemotaxis protein